MSTIREGDLLWTPTQQTINDANITAFIKWLADERGLVFADYTALWNWSTTEIEAFWLALWGYFELVGNSAEPVLASRDMPGAEWFPNGTINFAENIFAKLKADGPVIYFKSETQSLTTFDRADLYERVNCLATTLRNLGVEKGDCVVNYMPHIPETIIAMLAAASIGAIWSSCSPDFGSRSVLDRFSQIEPKVLFAVDGYTYGGKQYDRREIVGELQNGLPTLVQTILVPHVSESIDGLTDCTLWQAAVSSAPTSESIDFETVEFSHPLWVVYSSGTTGLPKPIVHGHGGITLEHIKSATFHNDLKPEDRFFWFTSTGWMMWNYLVGTLLSGCSIIVYDGSAGYPDMSAVWALAEETKMTYMGVGAAFVNACMKDGIRPNQQFDLSNIRGIGSTGSPLTVNGFEWIYENVNKTLALESLSGGTDLCTAFVGGARTLPIHAGEIQGPSLGAKIESWNMSGESVTDEVGELMITEPMPSMPLFFWNDDNMERYTGSYFEMFPGKWRHGDWIKINERMGCIIYGRSDSTINRGGIRMGTSEIYQAVEALSEIADSLVIDLEMLGRKSFMPLFVVLQPGETLTNDLQKHIQKTIRTNVSPRHVPNEIIVIDEIPYTLSGKKMEVPIRRILLGESAEKAANPGAMRNPHTLAYFSEYSKTLS